MKFFFRKKKPIHERKLFVKKLVDEEEFRPKLKHELDKQFLIAHTTKPKVDPFIVNTTRSNIKTKNAKGLVDLAKYFFKFIKIYSFCF